MKNKIDNKMKKVLFILLLQCFNLAVTAQNNINQPFHITAGYGYYNQYKNANWKGDEESNVWLQMGYFVTKRTFVGMEFENAAYKLSSNYLMPQIYIPEYEYVIENLFKVIGKYKVIEQERINVEIGSGLLYKISTKDYFKPVYVNSGTAYEKELAYNDKLGMPFFGEIKYDCTKKIVLGLRLSHNMIFKERDSYSFGITGGIKL